MYKNTLKCNIQPITKIPGNHDSKIGRQALNLQLLKQKGMDIRPACTFCGTTRSHRNHNYSECLYTQRFWTDIKDRAQPSLKPAHILRDRLLGIRENEYSMDDTPLREARSMIWGARSAKKTTPSSTRLSRVYIMGTLGYDYDLKHLDHLGQEEGQGLDAKGGWLWPMLEKKTRTVCTNFC